MAADVEWWHHPVTSDDISSSFRRLAGACDVHRRVEEKTDTQAVCVGACDVVWLPNSQVKWIEGQQGYLGGACDWYLSWESRICSGVCKSSRSHCLRVMARAAAVRGRVPGFWLRYAVEQVCLVGFIRRRLDVHKLDRERHGLGLRIWTQQWAMTATRCYGL